MRISIKGSTESIDLNEYEYITNVDGYQVYRKIIEDENGHRGIWVAQDQDRLHPPFSITYRQARGYDPITEYESNARRLGREVGQMLFGATNASPQYDRSFGFNRGENRYRIYVKNEDNPEAFQCQVSEIHPYDDAEYAWARKSSPSSLEIIKNGRITDYIPLPDWDWDMYEDETEYFNEIIDIACVALQEANSDVSPRMIHM